MNTVGVIAEFNPLHKGHEYLLQTAKKQCGAEYVIVIMSGSFTQRGEPAIYDKFVRTRWALSCGADLVIEMPTAAACASAKDFARCGVSLLAACGSVSHLAFGCENADLPQLMTLSRLLSTEPRLYKQALKQALKEGLSWPAARGHALTVLAKESCAGIDLPPKAALEQLLKQPNNILALEYLQAIHETKTQFNHSITPVPIQRIFAGYHDTSLSKSFCSASALRQAILNGGHSDRFLCHFPEGIRQDAAEVIETEPAMTQDALSSMLILRLLNTGEEDLSRILDMDPYLNGRIHNMTEYFTGFDDFAGRLATRAYTGTRISRVLLHILLGIQSSHRQDLIRCHYAPYLRILGFKKSSAPLLGQIKKNCQVPMISRPAAASRQLISPQAQQLFDLDTYAARIYQSLQSIKKGTPVPHEFRQKLVIL